MAIQSLLNNATVTSTSAGTVFRAGEAMEVNLVYDVTGAVAGTSPILQFFMVEIDPADESTEIGSTVVSNEITTSGDTGSMNLILTTSMTVKIYWTVTGAGASFAGVNAVVWTRPMHVVQTDAYSGYVPDPKSMPAGNAFAATDVAGAMITRGQAFTDEGSFVDRYTTNLTSSITGMPSFTSGSTSVTGVGTLFSTELNTQRYIKRTADPETAWTLIDYVIDDTQLELVEPYPGATGFTGSYTYWDSRTAATGLSLTSANTLIMTNSLSAGAWTSLTRLVDYGPLSVTARVAAVAKNVNQTPWFGFVQNEHIASASLSGQRAIVTFDPTLPNNQVTFRTAASNSDTQATTVTLPTNVVTGSLNNYTITLTPANATLLMSGTVLAQHNVVVPDPYQPLSFTYQIENSAAAAGSTALSSSFTYINNVDRVEIANSFPGDPVYTQLVGRTSGGLPQPIVGKFIPQYYVTTPTGSITITTAGLTTTSARGSAQIDNRATQYEDVLIFARITSAAASTVATGYCNIYGYCSVDGVWWPDGVTGTDSAVTLSNPTNLILIAQVTVNANSKTFFAGPYSFCRNYGIDRLPPFWGIVVQNVTGATLLNTPAVQSFTYTGVNAYLV